MMTPIIKITAIIIVHCSPQSNKKTWHGKYGSSAHAITSMYDFCGSNYLLRNEKNSVRRSVFAFTLPFLIITKSRTMRVHMQGCKRRTRAHDENRNRAFAPMAHHDKKRPRNATKGSRARAQTQRKIGRST
jgi:hypothetical protein